MTGDSVVAVKSTGYSNYGTSDQVSYTSMVIIPKMLPPSIKGTFVTNSVSSTNGNALIDGRNHNIDQTLSSPGGTGIVGIWSTGTVSTSGSSSVGGTASGIDYAPSSSPDPHIVLQNQTYIGGYPATADQVMGGSASGYPDGTLKSIAQSGILGGFYGTTIPAKTLSGVTYIDLSTGISGNDITGSGILIFNNTSSSAITLKLLGGTFTGLIILANNINIDKLRGTIVGSVITTASTQSGNVAINGNGAILYSSQAIQNSTKNLNWKKYVWFEH